MHDRRYQQGGELPAFGQPYKQAPKKQFGAETGQTLPHTPQLRGSLERSAQPLGVALSR